MMLGLSLQGFTLFHVALSLVGIATGLIALFGLIASKRLEGWTALFLATTAATSATGFGFPFDHLMPSHMLGIISLVVLAIAILARYGCGLAGSWRWIYVVSATIALYLNVVVLIVQAFQKVQPLHDLAPSQSEPPFLLAQGAALVFFVVCGLAALAKFRAPLMPRSV